MERDIYIDFLRALGLMLLIGVHVKAPEWYVAIRSFDVPLMVFVSALCYKSLRKGAEVTYFVKRFKRIYIPVLVFLIIYFSVAILSHTLDISEPSTIKMILGSLFLLNEPSIGFVWVMRVFLLMAILMPLLYKVTHGHKYTWAILIIGLFILQIIIVDSHAFSQGAICYMIGNQILLYAIGYSPIAILGLTISKLSYQQISRFVLIAMMILILVSGQMEFCPQIFKHPPSSIFQIYGLLMCSLLWLCRPMEGWNCKVEKCIPLISYLSKNSMWIYLWHIMALTLLWRVNRFLPIPWIHAIAL